MDNITKLQEIQARKDALIAQQIALSAQLEAVDQEEAELARIGRLDGIKQIGEIIKSYKIPKHEILNLYAELNLVFKNGRPTTYKKREEIKVNNPVLEDVAGNQETADRFAKLFISGMHTELMAEAQKCEELEEVLTLLPVEIEEYILENIT